MLSQLIRPLGIAAKFVIIGYIKRHAAELLLDYVIEQAEKLSKRTDTQLDDNAVAMLKSDRQDFIAAIKGRI